MAGMRLGYLVAAPEVVRACELVALPYHLDAAKQLAGRLALRYVREMEARVALLREERGRIAAGLAALPVETWPSDANFILFRPVGRPGPRRCGPTSSTVRCSCETVRSGRGSPGACG